MSFPGRPTPARSRADRWAVALLLASLASLAGAQSLPDRTVTIIVGGHGTQGAVTTGPFGVDILGPAIEEAAAFVGLPTMSTPGGPTDPSLVTGCSHYGDVPPAYYDADDLAELDAVTAAWGGGIPRYALIVAKFTRHVLQRTGAEQVNLVAVSMGALISRWMLENDLEGLMSEGRVARWLTYEAVLAGNWAASQEPVPSVIANVPALAIDLTHMHYDWVATHLHAPATALDGPLFRNVQIGHNLSTRDPTGALTAALWLTLGAFRPNDGLVLVQDGHFHEVTPVARFRDRMPTLSFTPVGHLQALHHQGLWAHIKTQLAATRRITVTLERARFEALSEWSPPLITNVAEVLFEIRIHSPWVEEHWLVDDALSARDREGATAPVVLVPQAAVWRTLDEVIFDDLLVDDEQQVRVELTALELDWDENYGVLELPGGTGAAHLGAGAFTLPLEDGVIWRVAAGSWEADLRVEVSRYPTGMTLWLPEADPPGSTVVTLAGEPVPLQVAAGPNQAGLPYLVLGSVSGTTSGGLLPLTWDGYTDALLASLNAPVHQGFLGVLDGMGRAAPLFNAAADPLPLAAAGITLTYAAVVFGAQGGVVTVTNPVQVTVEP